MFIDRLEMCLFICYLFIHSFIYLLDTGLVLMIRETNLVQQKATKAWDRNWHTVETLWSHLRDASQSFVHFPACKRTKDEYWKQKWYHLHFLSLHFSRFRPNHIVCISSTYRQDFLFIHKDIKVTILQNKISYWTSGRPANAANT